MCAVRNGSADAPVTGRLLGAWRSNARKIRPRLAIASLVARLLPHDMFNHRRSAVYRAAGLKLGRDVQILGPLTLLGWGNIAPLLEIGDEAAIETPCTISLGAPIRIGRRVHFGMEVMVLSGSHRIGGMEQRCGLYDFQSVEIGDGTWVGSRAQILPGVTIGPGCVIGAGAVVARSIPANSIVAGNPARIIGSLKVNAPATAVEAQPMPTSPASVAACVAVAGQ